MGFDVSYFRFAVGVVSKVGIVKLILCLGELISFRQAGNK